MFLKQKFTAFLAAAVVLLVLGGYFIFPKKPAILTKTQQIPSNQLKVSTSTQTGVQSVTVLSLSQINEDNGWKVYRDEKHGFEFRYPETWKYEFGQLQEVKNGRVFGIAGRVDFTDKSASSSLSFVEEGKMKMFTSDSRCPDVAGSIDYGDTVNVYCITEKEIKVDAGIWKGVVIVPASVWYGMNEKADSSTLPNEFWIDTKDFFYTVHLQYLEPIKNYSDRTVFFDKFLKGFSFF